MDSQQTMRSAWCADGELHAVGEEILWCDVRTVRPNDRTQFRIYSHLREDGGIMKRLEHRPPQHVFEIDAAMVPVAKCNVEDIRLHNHDVDNFMHRLVPFYGSGSMRSSGSCLLARSQFRMSSS